MTHHPLASFIRLSLAALVVGALALPSEAAAQDKPKLIVLPLSGSMELGAGDADYLLDAMFESASLRVAGHVSLIPKPQAKQAAKTPSGRCNEDCALTAAQKTNASIALLCELSTYKNSTIGFVKLLDTSDQTVLSAKRFIVQGGDLRQIEAGMHAAIRYVLSAQYLPLSQAQKAALASRQGEMPPPQYTAPSDDAPIEVGPVAPQPQPQPQPRATMPVYEEPEPEPEPLTADQIQRRKRAFLITASVLMPVGVGLALGGVGFLLRSQSEMEVFVSWDEQRNELVAERFKCLDDDPDTVCVLDNADDYQTEWYRISGYMDKSEAAMKSNNAGAIVFFAVGGAFIITSIVFFVQYAKTRNMTPLAAAPKQPRLSFTPVLSPDLKGAFLTASF